MASSLLMSFSPPSSPPLLSFQKLRLSSPNSLSMKNTNPLSSSKSLFGFPLTLSRTLSSAPYPSSSSNPNPKFTVFAHKGYKMKTHKASAKRFRVTGKGKIVRRRAGKQHLLVKKNSKRKRRLSKMHPVNRSDYNNVIGCLPYLKVNRKAT